MSNSLRGMTKEYLKMLRRTVLISLSFAVYFAVGQETQSQPVYKVGGEVTSPRKLFAPSPSYTWEARQKRIKGEVDLTVGVLPDGRTNNIRVVKSLDPGLDQSAVDAIRHWRFQPATKSGVPVAVEISVALNFDFQYVGGIPVPYGGPGVYRGLPCAAKIDSRDIKDLLKKAYKGDAKSQFVIGCACEYGVDRLAPDPAQAIDWYRKAAESLVPAQYFLGETYLSNFDYVRAYTWLKIAELNGYKDPKDWLKTVTELLSKQELSEAEEQVAAWQRQHH